MINYSKDCKAPVMAHEESGGLEGSGSGSAPRLNNRNLVIPPALATSRHSIHSTTAMPAQPGSQSRKVVSRIVFDKYDLDHSGSIEISEFRKLVYEFGYYLSEDELTMAVRVLDVDGDGSISYDEFFKWWSQDQRFESLRLSPQDFEMLNKAVQQFQKYDKDVSGSIDVREFSALHKDLARQGLTRKGVAATLEDFDSNKDGKISFNEFIQYFHTSLMSGVHK
ncbi:hypothetical protein SeLEV6574_g05020 [Synchytrium endobioticum]|uniref:EF-hand domain-containing protein n=1 Tax=Synchytrium endobioticum TaxID=286115 RepID=A0A507CWI0_9FUNG|nr:hypothetical protein SeLEV6574_g05020 [Synchytrium endobioticum]